MERTFRTLAIYRLAFGQPRLEELQEHLLDRSFSEDELEQIRETLIVNLCPICYSTIDRPPARHSEIPRVPS